ncbi:flagellar assembly protein A [Sulfobacillus harzensis]|nr:flagellar assembly protein A [Sulfobacillus harzensis]
MERWFWRRWQKPRRLPMVIPDPLPLTPITKSENMAPSPTPSPADKEGSVWLDGAGRVHVTNPQGEHGRFAVLSAADADQVTVLVNGRSVVGERVVEESDHIVVRAHMRAPSAQVRVEVSENEMLATLHVAYQRGERRVLQPTVPGPRLVLTTVSFPIDPPRVTVAQVRTELLRAGVISGTVATRELQTFLDRGESGSLVIARGTDPHPGAGSVEWIDDKRLDGSWMVETGAILAHRRPHPARPGTTVTGKTVAAPAIAPGRQMRLGPGVALMTHGTKLVAARSGYVIAQDGIVDVVDAMVIPEVTSAPDPLVLDGDVTVEGHISRRLVIVTGNLVIKGGIREAEVVVGGNVEVKGTVSDAAVFLGYGRYVQKRAEQHVGRIIDGLYDLEVTAEELLKGGGRSRFPLLLQQVIATKFTDILESLDWFKGALTWPHLNWSDALVRSIQELKDRLDQGQIDSMAELVALRTQLEYLEMDRAVEARPMGHRPMPC